jgi:hypothetical protein
MLAEATTSTRSDVLAALKQASAATGSDFEYLLSTATRESNLRPDAKAGTSSACGLFQFTQQTWLGMIKQHGGQHGLGSFADAIRQDSDGQYRVADKADRQTILALRNDPKISALMAGEYANETRSTLQSNLGRNVCGGELYAAHFLGPDAACRLIRLSDAKPETSAAAAFPDAASANRNVFYHRDGSAKTVREVYNWALGQSGGAASGRPAEASNAARATFARTASPSSDWMGYQLMDGGAGAFWSANTIPSGSFALTPGIIDILANLGSGDFAKSDKAA